MNDMKNSIKHFVIKTLSPSISMAITSHALKQARRKSFEILRKQRGAAHEVIFFYKVDDPHSVLLLQLLPQLVRDFTITLRPCILRDLEPSTLPEPELLSNWALEDAQTLAQASHLTFSDTKILPENTLNRRVEKALLSLKDSSNFLQAALNLTHALWERNENAILEIEQEIDSIDDAQYENQLKHNQDLLRKKGHYSSAMLYYAGEWYWGIDRIIYLAERLNALGIAKQSVNLSEYDFSGGDKNNTLSKTSQEKILQSNTPQDNIVLQTSSSKKIVDFYFSFRSPYSYLASQRLKEKGNINLNIKPVLPMVMRGLPVPSSKRKYIFLDTKRECERYNIPFGKVVDPLGEGVNRCMAIYPYARQKNLSLEYICSISKGIWAEGKDVLDNSILQSLCERAGLHWQEAETYLHRDNWKKDAEDNRNDMLKLGLWGVPSFSSGENVYWGQDRIWLFS